MLESVGLDYHYPSALTRGEELNKLKINKDETDSRPTDSPGDPYWSDLGPGARFQEEAELLRVYLFERLRCCVTASG